MDKMKALAQIAVAGDAQHFEALALYRLGQSANAQAGGVLGAEVLVNDHNRKTKFHGGLQLGQAKKSKQARSVRN
jgi:hypothetical protein